MTREILFRAKIIDKETIIGNDFYYGDLIHNENGSVYIKQPETGAECEVIKNTIEYKIGRAKYKKL